MYPRVDVLFVGGGISSMVAALELARAGGRVAIFERDPQPLRGGQCREAFGGLFFVDTPEQQRAGVKDSHELAWSDWQTYADFTADMLHEAAWARRYIERATPDVREWLIAQGLSFFPTVNWAERSHAGRGNSVPRFHLTWGCGPGIVSAVNAALGPYEGSRVRWYHDHLVSDLISEDGSIVGVVGTHNDQPFEARADHVVLASGGFTGSRNMLSEHWPTHWGDNLPDSVLNGVWPEIDGAMHNVARSHNAQLRNMNNLWVYAAGIAHWKPRYPGHGVAMIPSKSALWCDSAGRRFDPVLLAGYDTNEAISTIVKGPQPWSWQIMNTKILTRELTIQGSEFNHAFRNKKYRLLATELARGNKELAHQVLSHSTDVVSASTLRDLGNAMTALTPEHPIDVDGMMSDVQAYDAEVSRGRKLFTDPQLVSLKAVRSFMADRIRTVSPGPIVRPGEDLVAIRLRPVARKSLGGIATDEQCRVLDDTQQPVRGLCAIGEATGFGGGGMNGQRTLEGTLLGGAIFTAREFARHISL